MKIIADQHLRDRLLSDGIKVGEEVEVDDQSFAHFDERIEHDYHHVSAQERLALKVLCCLTHPAHQEHNHEDEPELDTISQHLIDLKRLLIVIAVLLFVLLSSKMAHCQYDPTAWHGSVLLRSNTGTLVGTVGTNFTLKAGANCTLTPISNGVTVNCTGAGGASAWDEITNPTAGGLSLTQFANGDAFFVVKRKTDTTPTGSFFDFQNALGSSLCKLDITGTFSACSFPYANLTGAPSLSTTVNGQTCTLGGSCTVADSTKVPTTTTVNGHALSANVTVTASDVSLGSVTNDAQTKAAIVPNTAPSAGQVLLGNAGGTAYAKQSLSGDATMDSAGAVTLATVNAGSGSCGDSTHVCQVTTNAKGLTTSQSAVAISGATLKNITVDAQGPVGPTTGNSAEQTIYTTTLATNTLQAGDYLRVTVNGKKTSGANSATWKCYFGATSFTPIASSATNQDWQGAYGVYVITSTTQQLHTIQFANGTSVSAQAVASPAENVASGTIVVKCTATVASPDTWNGYTWVIERLRP